MRYLVITSGYMIFLLSFCSLAEFSNSANEETSSEVFEEVNLKKSDTGSLHAKLAYTEVGKFYDKWNIKNIVKIKMREKLEEKSMCNQKKPEYLNSLCKKLLKLNDDSKMPIFVDKENCLDKILITETKLWRRNFKINLKVFPCEYRIKTINTELNSNGNENNKNEVKIITNKDEVSPPNVSGPGKDELDSSKSQPNLLTNNEIKVNSDKLSPSNGEMNTNENNKNQLDLKSVPSNEKSCSCHKCESDSNKDEKKVVQDGSNSSDTNDNEKNSKKDNPIPTKETDSVKNELKTTADGTNNSSQKEDVSPTSDDMKKSKDETITSQKAVEDNANNNELLDTVTKKDETAAVANGSEVITSKDETGGSASKNEINTLPNEQEDKDLEKLPIQIFFIGEAYKLKNPEEEAYLKYVPLRDDVKYADDTKDRSAFIQIEAKFVKQDVSTATS